jgi:Domain of unknown function (DUF4192)
MTTTLTARGPEDLLAAVPVVLGFRPSESLVMLTFGGRHTFHARVDLPEPDETARGLRELARSLLEPALQQGVDRVAFVAYTAQPRLASRLARCLEQTFVRAGVGVIDVLRAHDGRWTCVPRRPAQREDPPQPYDDRTHPFAAQAVFAGRITHPTRDDLRGLLAPDAELCRRVAKAGLALPPAGPDELGWTLDLLLRCVTQGHTPSDGESARLLRAAAVVELRDAALYAVGAAPQEHLELWSALLRRASDDTVPDVAALTAFCAWRSGHGALAWCALDRCFAVDPCHGLGLALAECLERALPPAAWEEVRDGPDADVDTA